MKSLPFVFALLLMASCTTQKKVAKFIKKNPELVRTVTKTVKDTVTQTITVELPGDTAFYVFEKIKLDTVFIESDEDNNVLAEFFGEPAIGDCPPEIKKVYVEVQSKPDTVIITEEIPIEVKVPFETVVIQPISKWQSIMMKAAWVTLPLSLLLLFFLVRRRKQ